MFEMLLFPMEVLSMDGLLKAALSSFTKVCFLLACRIFWNLTYLCCTESLDQNSKLDIFFSLSKHDNKS